MARSGSAAAPTPVWLEVGARWVFAGAVDWPGWCRRGRGEEGALEALAAYAPRYAVVAESGFAPGALRVVGRVGGDATTDFGAPGRPGPWDDVPMDAAEAERQAALLAAAWRAFDAAAAASPPVLRKGPRGGGRDRDAIVDHVRDAERAYGRKVGVRVPARTPWADQRTALLHAARDGASGAWTARYFLRRTAWHVLDHAWEIEDRRS
ncbi:MAG TPA: hypothetical protein VKV25_10975 [Acidimicrobiales bacterium]|nr:hypothetical protein [Acidimicrobiales bacterium]